MARGSSFLAPLDPLGPMAQRFSCCCWLCVREGLGWRASAGLAKTGPASGQAGVSDGVVFRAAVPATARWFCVVTVVFLGGRLALHGGFLAGTAPVPAALDLRLPASMACRRPLPAQFRPRRCWCCVLPAPLVVGGSVASSSVVRICAPSPVPCLPALPVVTTSLTSALCSAAPTPSTLPPRPSAKSKARVFSAAPSATLRRQMQPHPS